MTPPPVVEMLQKVADQCDGSAVRYSATQNFDVFAPALRSLADSLSEITPERVEALRYVAMTHHMNYDMETDFDECEDCADRRVALAALSRISSGGAKDAPTTSRRNLHVNERIEPALPPEPRRPPGEARMTPKPISG